ncbi:Hypothetical protein BCD_1867 (plasmid) [Borrelia crocidurae DOU]|uniref:Uncharacterized protein n=1 Tax=Borrelia crocidurae DOU TaxID=1293575 RepID=W5SMT5_9SPIR|nr:Hypothetical protein BCD_1867 [Borrelia crocidurae DOU]
MLLFLAKINNCSIIIFCIFNKVVKVGEIMKYNSKINSYELYKHSIFFRNYINNVSEDVLYNGITLEIVYSTDLKRDK